MTVQELVKLIEKELLMERLKGAGKGYCLVLVQR